MLEKVQLIEQHYEEINEKLMDPNVVSDQEMLYEVLHGGPSEDCCRRLLDIALNRGAPDNVTCVLIQTV